MKFRGIKVLSAKLLVVGLVLFIMLGPGPRILKSGVQGPGPFIVKPVYAQGRINTTVYLPSVDKNLTTGEVNKYYSVGGVTLQRSSKQGGAEKLYYLFPDHLSSTGLIINKEQTETSYLSYYPYGNTRSTGLVPSSVTNLYTGQEKDQEINLYYYNARYYNPITGHFISADKAQGPNRYSYTVNNPTNSNDPTGTYSPNNSILANLGIKMSTYGAINRLNATYFAVTSEFEEIQYIPLSDTKRLMQDALAKNDKVDYDPTWGQIKQYMGDVSKETGVPLDVLLSLGVRENWLQGIYPQMHGDQSGSCEHGLLCPSIKYWNDDTSIQEHKAGPWNWDVFANFAYHDYEKGKTDPGRVTNVPGWFVAYDYKANIWAGTMIYLDALERLTDPNDRLYKEVYKTYVETGEDSIWGAAWAVYHHGGQNLPGNYYNLLLGTGYDAATLFDKTLNEWRFWENGWCDEGGYCWKQKYLERRPQ